MAFEEVKNYVRIFIQQHLTAVIATSSALAVGLTVATPFMVYTVKSKKSFDIKIDELKKEKIEKDNEIKNLKQNIEKLENEKTKKR